MARKQNLDFLDASVDRALTLVTAIRDRGPDAVTQVTDPLDRGELVALAVALAALCPADVDPWEALTWVNLPVDAWPDRIVFAEACRADAGATDATALAGAREAVRRRRAVLRSIGPTRTGVRRAAGGAA